MFHQLSFRQLTTLLFLLLLFWFELLPLNPLSPAIAANAPQSITENASINLPDWDKIDSSIAAAIKKVRLRTEEFANHQLDFWVAERMRQVDDQFLNWYFDFFHQKATQDGMPFAWLAFQADFLNLLKAEDEKGLSADQIIQKRMLEEFEQKFNEMVLNETAIDDLRSRIKEVADTYASAVEVQFDLSMAKYHVSEQDWQQHNAQISQLIYNTGTSQSSLQPESLSILLTDKILTQMSAVVGSKLAITLGVKMAPKLAIKGGAIAIAGTGAKFIDPILIFGVLTWDVVDYQQMVNKSRPELRKNIEDYLNIVKLNILDAPDGSIMATLDEVEEEVETALVNQTISDNG